MLMVELLVWNMVASMARLKEMMSVDMKELLMAG
jgi:hypothetical protein